MSLIIQLKNSFAILWRGSRGIALLAIAAGWSLSLGSRMIYPALLPALRETYGMGLTMSGLLITVLWLAYAVGQLPGGVFTDRIGERDVLVLGTVAAAFMLTLVVFANSVPILFAATALFGLGTALYGVARFTAATALYPDNGGTAIGITLAAGQVGNAVLPATAGALAAVTAWQFGFGFTLPLFIVVATVLWIVVPATLTADNSAVDTISFETIRYVMRSVLRPDIVIVTIILTLAFGLWLAFTGFYPTYLIEVKGLSPTVAASFFGLFFALGIGIQPAAGAAYDRFGIRRTLPVLFILAMSGLIALPLLEGFWPLLVVTAVLSCMLGNIAILLPHLTVLIPDNIRGTGIGLLRTIYMLIAATSSVLFGAVAERGFFDEAFWLLAGVLVINLVLVFQLPKAD